VILQIEYEVAAVWNPGNVPFTAALSECGRARSHMLSVEQTANILRVAIGTLAG